MFGLFTRGQINIFVYRTVVYVIIVYINIIINNRSENYL